MSSSGRVESVDLTGTGRSRRAGNLAAMVAAAQRFADIHGVAGRSDEGRLAGSPREFASIGRPAATAAKRQHAAYPGLPAGVTSIAVRSRPTKAFRLGQVGRLCRHPRRPPDARHCQSIRCARGARSTRHRFDAGRQVLPGAPGTCRGPRAVPGDGAQACLERILCLCDALS